jgi:hypothetical protein
MFKAFTNKELKFQNIVWRGTGALSAENRGHGFIPAFLDAERGEVHPSCYACGGLATIHILDGLPKHLVLANEASGRVSEVKNSVIAGFMREGKFYTREEAATTLKDALTDS